MAKLVLKNPLRPDLQPVEVDALADPGGLYLCIPRRLQLQLDLAERGTREVTLADGAATLLPYVGPLELRFDDRVAFTGAVVIGEEVLLGAIPREGMDLVIVPNTRNLAVNPRGPHGAPPS